MAYPISITQVLGVDNGAVIRVTILDSNDRELFDVSASSFLGMAKKAYESDNAVWVLIHHGVADTGAQSSAHIWIDRDGVKLHDIIELRASIVQTLSALNGSS